MAWQVMALAAKTDDLCSNFRHPTHCRLEGKNQLPQAVLRPPCLDPGLCVHPL